MTGTVRTSACRERPRPLNTGPNPDSGSGPSCRYAPGCRPGRSSSTTLVARTQTKKSRKPPKPAMPTTARGWDPSRSVFPGRVECPGVVHRYGSFHWGGSGTCTGVPSPACFCLLAELL